MHYYANKHLLTLLSICLCCIFSTASAEILQGEFKVCSAYINVDNKVFLLHAQVEYPLNAAIRQTLHEGLTLTYDLDVRIERERRFWFDAAIVDLTLRRELSYHAVTERYLVREKRSASQESFATLEQAIEYLGKVERWPIIVEPQLNGGNYRVGARAAIRRGRLPTSLRTLFFWTEDWHRESEWYQWSLPV